MIATPIPASTPRILAEIDAAYWRVPNGGQRRTQQLHELILGAGIEIEALQPGPLVSNLRHYLRGLRFMMQDGLRARCHPRLIRRFGMVARRLEHNAARHRGNRVLLWELTHGSNQALPHLARRLGYAVLATPQNLESLVPRPGARRCEQSVRRLAEEVRSLQAADATFAIGREEQWLLATLGVSADFLPYYPATAVARQLQTIRERRRALKPERLLVLGSASNPPTRQGMMALIELLRALPRGNDLPVDIAGFETESLRPLVEGTQFRVHGAANEAELEELLLGARAMIAHQVAAAGTLSRITEMLLAGLPVFANAVAARSQHHHQGVAIYESPEELSALLRQPRAETDPPARPTGAEQRFITTLRQLLADQGSCPLVAAVAKSPAR